MKHKTAYKISVALSILGLVLMYGASVYIQIEKVGVSDIESSWQGRNVVVDGEAVNVTRSDSHLFFDLKNEKDSILIVEFDSRSDIRNGDTVEVTGKVEVYEGKLEVIAENVKESE